MAVESWGEIAAGLRPGLSPDNSTGIETTLQLTRRSSLQSISVIGCKKNDAEAPVERRSNVCY